MRMSELHEVVYRMWYVLHLLEKGHGLLYQNLIVYGTCLQLKEPDWVAKPIVVSQFVHAFNPKV